MQAPMGRVAALAAVSLLASLAAVHCSSISSNANARKLLQDPCSLTRASGAYVGENNCAGCASKSGTVAWCCTDDDTASPSVCKEATPNTCCSGAAYNYREDDDDTDDLDNVWCVPSSCSTSFNPGVAARDDDRDDRDDDDDNDDRFDDDNDDDKRRRFQ